MAYLRSRPPAGMPRRPPLAPSPRSPGCQLGQCPAATFPLPPHACCAWHCTAPSGCIYIFVPTAAGHQLRCCLRGLCSSGIRLRSNAGGTRRSQQGICDVRSLSNKQRGPDMKARPPFPMPGPPFDCRRIQWRPREWLSTGLVESVSPWPSTQLIVSGRVLRPP